MTDTPLTDQQPTARAESYRALVTGGTFIRRVGLTHPEHAEAALDAYRDQVLTEAAELLQAQHAAVYEDAGQKVASGLLRAADLLLAARTAPDAR